MSIPLDITSKLFSKFVLWAIQAALKDIQNQLSIPDAHAYYPCPTAANPAKMCDTLIASNQNGVMYNKDKDQCEVKGKKVECPPEALQKVRCRVNALVGQVAKVLRTASGQAINSALSLGGQQLSAFDQCNCTPAPATCGAAPAPAPAPVQATEIRTLGSGQIQTVSTAPTLSIPQMMPVFATLVLPPLPNLKPAPQTIPDQGRWWQRALASPWTRLAMAGTMGVMSGLAVKNVKEQIEASENRETYIRKVRQQIEGYEEGFTCSDKDRNDPGVPKCYCYTEAGQTTWCFRKIRKRT